MDQQARSEKMLPSDFIKVIRPAYGRVPGDGVGLAFGYWPGRAAPVVALHGLTASHMNFIGIAERLAGRCALFGLDLRGRGDSDKPEGPYGLAQHARDVASAMRAMGLGPSIIVGHSDGSLRGNCARCSGPQSRLWSRSDRRRIRTRHTSYEFSRARH